MERRRIGARTIAWVGMLAVLYSCVTATKATDEAPAHDDWEDAADLVELAGTDDAMVADDAADLGYCTDDGAFGLFPDPAKYQDDGSGRVDLLLEEFRFIDRDGRTWTACEGLPWDGASIPRALWTVAGSPKVGCHKLASIVHDEYYKHRREHGYTRKEVDRMFYDACRAKGVGRAKAKSMYYALRWFGQRWDDAELPFDGDWSEDDQCNLIAQLEESLAGDDMELETLDVVDPRGLTAMLR